MIFEFDHDDTMLAVEMGRKHTEACAKAGRKDGYGLINDDPVENARRQTIGFLGELAVCRLFDHPFEYTPYQFKAPDLSVNAWGIQVKSSEHAKNLIIRPTSEDFEPYILCHVQMPYGDPRKWASCDPETVTSTVILLGWMFPYYARLLADVEPSLWRDPNERNSPAIFIPADWLSSVESLISLTQTSPSGYNLE